MCYLSVSHNSASSHHARFGSSNGAISLYLRLVPTQPAGWHTSYGWQSRGRSYDEPLLGLAQPIDWSTSFGWELLIPYGSIALLPGLILAARSAIALRRRFGHCAICGYDLRATPTRCPECGTVPPSRKTTPP